MADIPPGIATPAVAQIRAPVAGVRRAEDAPKPGGAPYTEVDVAISGGVMTIVYEGAYAEAAAATLRQGFLLGAEGELTVQRWSTKKSGDRRRVVVKARTMRILSRPERTVESVP